MGLQKPISSMYLSLLRFSAQNSKNWGYFVVNKLIKILIFRIINESRRGLLLRSTHPHPQGESSNMQGGVQLKEGVYEC